MILNINRKLLASAILLFGLSITSTAFAELGSSDEDLVYTPIQPCRIFDTRTTGIIGAGTFQNFFVYGDAATIGGQGGNAAGCSAPQGEPLGVHLNITVVPQGDGHIRVFPKGTALPGASTINYKSGVNIANAITAKSTFNIADSDISIYSSNSAHVLADVLGFYYPARLGYAYDGYDLLSGQVIDTSAAENVTDIAGHSPAITVEAGDAVFYSATVMVKPAVAGNVEVNLYPCRLANGTATPILQTYTNFDQELEACYTGLTTADHIIIPVTGVIPNVPAGTWEFSICADKSASIACATPQNFGTQLQQMTVIKLGK